MLARVAAAGLRALALALCVLSVLAFDSVPHCEPSMPAAHTGEWCWLHITDVRPTEYAFGPNEVSVTKASVERHYDAGADDWAEHQTHVIVPIVIGPGGFYAVDKHHRCLGLFLARIPDDEKQVLCHVARNQRDLAPDEFLHYLYNEQLVWTSDVKGLREMDPITLPPSWSRMLPDPYRDLAGYVRSRHGFDSGLYVEFHWANFYRTRIAFPREPRQPELAEWCDVRPYDNGCYAPDFDEESWIRENLARAIELSQQPEASHLPGYHPGVLLNARSSE